MKIHDVFACGREGNIDQSNTLRNRDRQNPFVI